MPSGKEVKNKAISLFCSSGIGDLGITANDIEVVLANEIVEERANLFQANNPDTTVVLGDIWQKKEEIIKLAKSKIPREELFLINATPPCQGMSLAGMGKMLNDFRKGKRPDLNPKFDERNRLIIPAVEIINELQPKWVIMENVENMQNTLIYDESGELISILDFVFKNLTGYVGTAEVINVADYGVPQYRKRLITILSRDPLAKEYFYKTGSFLPEKTNSNDEMDSCPPWITLRDAIWNLPSLDAVKGKNKDVSISKYHEVPVWDPKKYFWMSNTPEGETAFNNQCINPQCMYSGNKRHGMETSKTTGITESNKDTPLYCEKCGSLLPRPYVEQKNTGEKRIMKGYVSAYKRMFWDKPASTITTRFQFVSSDHNVHPDQNRVLSLYEGMVLQTISDYDFVFEIDGKRVNSGLIRDTIGESIPPKVIDLIMKNLLLISSGGIRDSKIMEQQMTLFAV